MKSPIKYKHKIKLLPINEVYKNPYNPNEMDENTYSDTKKNIEKEGFIGAIIVRKVKDQYMIIDGEHRWRAAGELGYKEIPAIILDKKLPEAMISTLNFNKLRGDINTIKLAGVIYELHKTYSLEELEETLGYTQEELKGIEDLVHFDPDKAETTPKLDDSKKMNHKFDVMLSKKQYNVVDKAIEFTGKNNTAQALIEICLFYIKKHGKGSP